MTIRQLTHGDESILEFLALNDADFDLAGRGEPLEPLSDARMKKYLENPNVLHWVAFDHQEIVGSLLCHVLPMDSGSQDELVLYDIGVHHAWRRRGVGRGLMHEMEAWMRQNNVNEVWVLADNKIAANFYRALGFTEDDEQPTYMWRDLSG